MGRVGMSDIVGIVARHDAQQNSLPLLTGPRINEENYLFHSDNFFSPPPPPDAVDTLGDLNIGRSY